MERYKALFKEAKLTSKIVGDIISFIDARHLADIKEAKKLQGVLKKKLGSDFTKVLNKFGDPDDPKISYSTVRNKWLEFLQQI